MKNILGILAFVFVITVVAFGLFSPQQNANEQYLRIHIRANSNSEVDQNIKYQIKDKVVEKMIPLLCDIQDKQDAMVVVKQNLVYIESIADKILYENGFTYNSKARLTNESFPTRSYNEFVLEEGFYDALILELGEAKGDNWWCVVYPPLCFLNSNNPQNVIYKSKIVEIINNGKK